MQIYFSRFWKLRSPKLRLLQIQCLLRGHFFLHRWPFLWLCLCTAGGVKELSGVSLIMALIPLKWAPTTWPIHPQEIPPPNTLTLGIRFQHVNLLVDTNFQSIAAVVVIVLNFDEGMIDKGMIELPWLFNFSSVATWLQKSICCRQRLFHKTLKHFVKPDKSWNSKVFFSLLVTSWNILSISNCAPSGLILGITK